MEDRVNPGEVLAGVEPSEWKATAVKLIEKCEWGDEGWEADRQVSALTDALGEVLVGELPEAQEFARYRQEAYDALQAIAEAAGAKSKILPSALGAGLYGSSQRAAVACEDYLDPEGANARSIARATPEPAPLAEQFPGVDPKRVRSLGQTPEFQAQQALLGLSRLLPENSAEKALLNQAWTPAMQALGGKLMAQGFTRAEHSAALMVSLGQIALPDNSATIS